MYVLLNKIYRIMFIVFLFCTLFGYIQEKICEYKGGDLSLMVIRLKIHCSNI